MNKIIIFKCKKNGEKCSKRIKKWFRYSLIINFELNKNSWYFKLLLYQFVTVSYFNYIISFNQTTFNNLSYYKMILFFYCNLQNLAVIFKLRIPNSVWLSILVHLKVQISWKLKLPQFRMGVERLNY